MTDFQIRPAEPGDVGAILDLVRQLADYEKALDMVVCTEADLLRDGFGERPVWECLVAEMEQQVVGMAMFFPTWSTWSGRSRMYLEDLFVSPKARGKGLGFALLRELARIVKQRNYVCLEWSVLDWNQPARDFYHQIGAFHREEWLPYRIEGKALEDLAQT